MAQYFSNFPKTYYLSGANNVTSVDVVTNITARFGFEQSLKENASAFYKYDIQESDTPEIIASKFYGNPERHWIVLSFNDIIDPQYDWPMTYSTFVQYVDKKYQAQQYANNSNTNAGVSWAMNTSNVKSYYKVITRTSDSPLVTNKTSIEKIEIDANTYANVVANTITRSVGNGINITQTISKETETYYDYEMNLNESKRTIKLLKPEFVNSVEVEFKRIVRQ